MKLPETEINKILIDFNKSITSTEQMTIPQFINALKRNGHLSSDIKANELTEKFKEWSFSNCCYRSEDSFLSFLNSSELLNS